MLRLVKEEFPPSTNVRLKKLLDQVEEDERQEKEYWGMFLGVCLVLASFATICWGSHIIYCAIVGCQ